MYLGLSFPRAPNLITPRAVKIRKNTWLPTGNSRWWRRRSVQFLYLSCATLSLCLTFLTTSTVLVIMSSPRIFLSPTLSQAIGDLQFLPNNASNGAIWILVWKLLLLENTTRWRWSSQELQILKYTTWACPPRFEWYALIAHLSVGDKLCWISIEYPSYYAKPFKNMK